MEYKNILPATFIDRPNRFIAHVELDGRTEVCHVKNTGRCKELLLPGCQVFVQRSENPQRKTAYDLISVRKKDQLINIDSQAPNQLFEEYVHAGHLFEDVTLIRREVAYKNSRFDFYIETKTRKFFAEVKGVTLEEKGMALFPDAPTERGLKHLRELLICKGEGFLPYVVFIIQMKGIRSFSPNDKTHKDFGDMLRLCKEKGVGILALDCKVTEKEIRVDKTVPVVL